MAVSLKWRRLRDLTENFEILRKRPPIWYHSKSVWIGLLSGCLGWPWPTGQEFSCDQKFKGTADFCFSLFFVIFEWKRRLWPSKWYIICVYWVILKIFRFTIIFNTRSLYRKKPQAYRSIRAWCRCMNGERRGSLTSPDHDGFPAVSLTEVLASNPRPEEHPVENKECTHVNDR
jgi:hypothetical protein